jgi:prepilin-type N-terminal cleavage/methylation domain-containing protein
MEKPRRGNVDRLARQSGVENTRENGSPVYVLDRYRNRGAICRAGFTLVEIVVALAVLSIATTILISMLGRGIALGDHSRYRTVAANVGQSILAEMQARPTAYVWPSFEDLQSGGVVEVTPEGVEPGSEGHPVAAPPGADADRGDAALYSRLRWLAHGRRPVQSPDVLELTVTVFWTEAGRPYSLTLTTAYPRAFIENPS